MSEIKFRAWDKVEEKIYPPELVKRIEYKNGKSYKILVDNEESGELTENWLHWDERVVLMQSTGLLDKNGKEIYELMEINKKYRVVYKAPCYVLTDVSTNDIIELDNSKTNQYEITREYSPIS